MNLSMERLNARLGAENWKWSGEESKAQNIVEEGVSGLMSSSFEICLPAAVYVHTNSALKRASQHSGARSISSD